MSESYEQLSRYRAGELTPEAMRALEAQPGFAERLQDLKSLDAAVVALPVDDLPDEKLATLMAKVKRPEPVAARRPRLELRVGFAAAAVVVALLGWTFFGPAPEPWVVVPSGDVRVDGLQLSAPATQNGAWNLVVADDASAQLAGLNAAVFVPGGATLSHGRTLSLHRGTVLVRAEDLTVGSVTVNGISVLTMEPAAEVARVTELLSTTPSGALMKNQWLKLSTVAASAAAVGIGLTLFVLDGHASVRPGEGGAVIVNAGEKWNAADAKSMPFKVKAPVVEAALTGPSTRPTELQAMTQPQLIAMVEALRDEKEVLLKQREALKRDAEDKKDRPKKNYYRIETDELTASAKKGELRFRGPQMGGTETQIDPKVRDDVALTAEEMARIKEIFEASSARVRTGLIALYKEMGGDPNFAASLGTETIFNELRNKALKGDFAESIRTLAEERAGLIPVGNPAAGPIVMRAARVFLTEDERVIAELEKLLGSRRAEEYLNHPDTQHHDNTFGVGPRAPAHPGN